jgi:cytochrome oxidase Cu insertion factor (SCO1/SenC/PrrC family)
VGLFLLSYQWGNQYRFGADRVPTLSGVLIRPPQPLPDVVLDDSNGAPFGRADLLERWSLLGFAAINSANGHRSIARLVEIYNRLADRPDLRRQVRLLLVSADSVPRLARDFERLSPAIAVLGGAPDQMEILQAALGVEPRAPATPPPPGTIPPGTTPSQEQLSQALPPLFLIDPEARLVALFPSSQSAATIAEDVAALADWPGLESAGQ